MLQMMKHQNAKSSALTSKQYRIRVRVHYPSRRRVSCFREKRLDRDMVPGIFFSKQASSSILESWMGFPEDFHSQSDGDSILKESIAFKTISAGSSRNWTGTGDGSYVSNHRHQRKMRVLTMTRSLVQ